MIHKLTALQEGQGTVSSELTQLISLREQFLAEHPRPSAQSHDALVEGLRSGRLSAFLVEPDSRNVPATGPPAPAGYFVTGLQVWNGQQVLWADELYLVPEARKQGRLEDITSWLQWLARTSGATAVMGLVTSLQEGKVFQDRLGMQPHAMILSVSVRDLRYRPAAPTAVAEPAPVAEEEAEAAVAVVSAHRARKHTKKRRKPTAAEVAAMQGETNHTAEAEA
jgi:hypothetical protein